MSSALTVKKTPGEHKGSGIPRSPKPLGEVSGLLRAFKSEFWLEISGTRFVLRRVSHTKKGTNSQISDPKDLTAQHLRSELRIFSYTWQPLTIILHPPETCLKAFLIGSSPLEEWLAKHFDELFPPGNRHEMLLSYAIIGGDSILASTIERAGLTSKIRTIEEAGGVVGSIFPAAALDLLSPTISGVNPSLIRWGLLDYKYQYRDGLLSIGCCPPVQTSSVCSIKSESGHAGNAMKQESHSKSGGAILPLGLANFDRVVRTRPFDFASHLRIPKPLPPAQLLRVLQITVVITLIIAVMTAALFALKLTSRTLHAKETDQYFTTSQQLGILQTENSRLRHELQELEKQKGNSTSASKFLHVVAVSVPERAWLTELNLQDMEGTGGHRFEINGNSLDEQSLSMFRAMLVKQANVASADIINISRGQSLNVEGTTIPNNKLMVRFEIQGSTRSGKW